MRIGVFGGSFDPIHTGHAAVANELSQRGIFDRVWLCPARINPLKAGGVIPASGSDRMEMCRLVASRCAAVDICDIEFDLPEPSYTYLTLCELSRRFPEHQFRIIIGSDNWETFRRWKEPDKIIKEFGVVIYPRPGYEIKDELPQNVEILDDVPQVLVSSTYIRERISCGRNVNFLVPGEVLDYIGSHELYR